MSALLLCVALAAHSQDWAKTKLEKSPRHQEWVKLKHGDREVNCFVVYPEVKDKATTIVLIHEIFGLTDWAEEMADEFAAEGYIVIAPDLLYGSVTNGGTEELIKSGGNVGKAIQAQVTVGSYGFATLAETIADIASRQPRTNFCVRKNRRTAPTKSSLRCNAAKCPPRGNSCQSTIL